ncbi:toll/interleukin-1 receptor domain-containing protein [Pleomorphomonas sp. JP5]|uniref:toll/interleukin-1 receptor domain-containing protein n=1 Tax=Pleomorphomonas sp. JP5 TaxID=2942998 RepID=UPI0020446ED2|nr:toll/interleukin-1 receptor domain-containing protein [Pleomorphomonas sp. JP5]MCM5557061.1 toll/interleukin-1 receptor domain-containing protein [Pleomorphomonas sp. JP5]
MVRDTIFICHATPEDNDFVRWLGARLTGHGYKIWADMFGLKGGTPFWNTIEDALREHACKVIYVASKVSVDPKRQGVRNELSVADAVKKALKDPAFIIPVRLDDVAFSDFPILVHQLNALDFSNGWGRRLIELLDTLETANVPRTDHDQTAEFERWRQDAVKTAALVTNEAEPVLASLSPINALPAQVRYLRHNANAAAIDLALRESGIPFAPFYQLLITFAGLDEINAALPPPMVAELRVQTSLESFLSGQVADVTTPGRADASNIATALLRQHIERHLAQRGLKVLQQRGANAFYFPDGLVPNNKVPYMAASGRRTNKNVVGRSRRNKVYWHLAMKVSVVLGPPAFVRFKPYVAFSDDGQTAITDPKRTSPIRRRFCKNWWNQHWRQLQEAFAVWLAEGQTEHNIVLDGSQRLVLSGRLLQLTAERHIVGDLQFQDEAEEPDEPDEDDDDFVIDAVDGGEDD